jgi:hypothetical protein
MRRDNWFSRLLGQTQDPVPAVAGEAAPAVTMRFAGQADADALERQARLDSSRAPRGVVLLAEVGGELWSAVSLDDGHVVADPFRPTGELAWLLLQRSRRLRREYRREREGLPRVWPTAPLEPARR